MTYDALNRLVTQSYSNGTPAVTYCYDGNVAVGGGTCTAASPAIPNPLTHLTQEYSSASATTYTAFDAMGHVTASNQQTGGTTYSFGAASSPGYVYNLGGQLTSETYPSGRKVTFDYDAAGRTAHVDNPGNGVIYANLSLFNPSANQYAYAPNGAIQAMTLGNAVTENWIWDPIRLLPTQTQIGSLLTLNYYYCPNGGTSCSSNNGNMLRQTINTPALGTVTQNYSYTDGFNRLTNAAETNAQSQQTWQQTFQYDSYGNKALTSGYTQYAAQTPGSLTAFNSSNQWTSAGYSGGNVTTLPQRAFSYDGENRLTASTQPGTPAISYGYDGDGKRVQKTVGSAVTTYVYDASSELVAEYGTPTDTGTTYVSVDHLGSTRLLQHGSGTTNYYDYLPFGEDLPAGVGGRNSSYTSGIYPASGPDFVPIKFTGKERDWETGLDFFQARYYTAWQGRFGQTDPGNAGADSSSPQTYHGYAYVTNIPLTKVDPSGLYQAPTGDLYSGSNGITIDGADYIGKGNLGGNGLPPCPGNVCSGWMTDGKGQIAYSQFFARASGSRRWQTVGPWVGDPSEPINQIYEAFKLAAKYAQTPIDPSASIKVDVRYVGTTYNVQIPDRRPW